jgi:hypothetical protein
MPYELSFEKRLPIRDPDLYINECCWGGDAVVERLRPVVEGRYQRILIEQEDWGWFLWFKDGAVSLAVDVFCDDPETGAFRAHLTSRTKKWIVFDTIVDTEALETMKDAVVERLGDWVDSPVRVVRLDRTYAPVEDGANEADSP